MRLFISIVLIQWVVSYSSSRHGKHSDTEITVVGMSDDYKGNKRLSKTQYKEGGATYYTNTYKKYKKYKRGGGRIRSGYNQKLGGRAAVSKMWSIGSYPPSSPASERSTNDRGRMHTSPIYGNIASNDNAYNAVFYPAFQTCLSAIKSPAVAVFPGDGAFKSATQVFQARFIPQSPAAVLFAYKSHDVQSAVRCANAAGVQVSVASGRHSYFPITVIDGHLLIDLSNMTGVKFSKHGDTAVVQPGVHNVQMTWALHDRFPDGRAIFPSGACPWVGVGGYTLGGGIGVLSRYLGLACDQVQGIDMVTSTGALIHANKDKHSELLWAACGAGSGMPGIITAFHVKISFVEKAEFTYVEIRYEAGKQNIIKAWNLFQAWYPTMSNRFGMFIQILGGEWELTGVYVGPRHEIYSALMKAGMLGNPDLPVSFVYVEQVPSYWDYNFKVVADAAATPDHTSISGDWWNPTNERTGKPEYNAAEMLEFIMNRRGSRLRKVGGQNNKSWLGVSSRMSGKHSPAEIETIATFAVKPAFAGWWWVIGGAVADVAPTDTAFWNRDAWYVEEGSVEFCHDVINYQPGDNLDICDDCDGEHCTAGFVQSALDMLKRYDTRMNALKKGPLRHYINYISGFPLSSAVARKSAWWGKNTYKLIKVSSKWDPTRMFDKPIGSVPSSVQKGEVYV